MKTKLSFILTALILAIGSSSCTTEDEINEGPDNSEDYNFLLALSLPAIDSYPFHILKDIESGVANVSGSQEIPDLPYNVPVTTQEGTIYLNSAEKLTKYEVGEDGILNDLGSISNLGISGGPVFEFLDENSLLISSGPRATSDGVFDYQVINTTDMTEEATGSITLPTDENSKSIPCDYILKEGKIYVPYIHSDNDYAAYDEAPVAIFDAATMAYEKTIYTDKTASLSYSVVSSYGFSENGDLYITSCNSNYWGGNESLPSGIVRINAGESEFDNYFFNLTEKLDGNHTGGMLYLGDNKALVQVFRSDLIEEYGDYQGGFVIEYHLVDLETKSVEKLDIPLCKYPRRAMTLLENGKAAIMANTENEGNNIYIYAPATNSVSKGLSYEGAEYISTLLSFE